MIIITEKHVTWCGRKLGVGFLIFVMILAPIGGSWVGTATASHGTQSTDTEYIPPPNVVRETPIVSARGHVGPKYWTYYPWDAVSYRTGHSLTDYETTGDIPGMHNGVCPPEIVVYVHGYGNNEVTAVNNFNTAQASLRTLGYSHPIVGFSWDSNEGLVPLPWWDITEIVADMTGTKLGQFLIDYKSTCPGTDVRVVAHSLGSRVVLRGIGHIDTWDGPRIKSIHFLGSAVDPSLVTLSDNRNREDTYGLAVHNHVGQLHNKFSNRDEVLWAAYPVGRGGTGSPLGLRGARANTDLPRNYHEQDVTSLVKDGAIRGDHSAYAQTNANGGVMDLVVNDWRNEDVIELLQDGSPPTNLGFELETTVRQYNDRIPRTLKLVLSTDDRIAVIATVDDVASDAYLVQFDNDGNAQVERYGRAITGNTPMMVEEQGRWIYKPVSQSWVRGSPDDLVAILRSCDAITTYERSISDGTIEHQLSRVATSIYWTILTLKGAFNEAFDRPGDDLVGACEPVS